jgi:competence protein ComEA
MHYGQALRIATEYLAGSMMSRLFAAIIAASLLASAMACAFAQTRPVPGQTPASVIDLNTASRDDLMTLDGIGEVRADAIIRARPFRAKTELVERRLIPEALYDKIADKVMARPPPSATPTPATRPPAKRS